MKARLKYPIFSFAPKGNMIYVFRKEELYTTTNTKLLKKRKNYIVVDATGTKYVEKRAHKVKWQGILGYCIRIGIINSLSGHLRTNRYRSCPAGNR
ncbi:hypothetical protein [Bacteroides caecimuris]|uniref:hypothetical protein n=1 Tax=Bacteroides caecimuris TaxID=1796613 RepID=UPI0020CE5681|nr:hypothetical protein [Bacteroides caecimuris]